MKREGIRGHAASSDVSRVAAVAAVAVGGARISGMRAGERATKRAFLAAPVIRLALGDAKYATLEAT
jgi:hypothetical protein